MRPPARVPCGGSAARLAAAALWLLAGLAAARGAVAATLVVNVRTPDGHALPGAVITVRPLDGPGRRPAPVRAVMDQADRAFKPDLLVIPVGSTVEFPNSDSVSHQIYSFSPAKRFQLPLYRGKPYPPVHFDQPGVVTLGCNIHDQMLAYLLVTDAPWYGRSNEAGAWSSDVPRGRYRVELWHPRLREGEQDLERELTVGDADRAELTVQLTKPLLPAPLAERPHSWDY
ncbi:MAG TPA: methylamine utilization protein [Steroidobacteraceae bacterium]|nr:methylamine utilization protein [Steroidobacteraceae bacterium]